MVGNRFQNFLVISSVNFEGSYTYSSCVKIELIVFWGSIFIEVNHIPSDLDLTTLKSIMNGLNTSWKGIKRAIERPLITSSNTKLWHWGKWYLHLYVKNNYSSNFAQSTSCFHCFHCFQFIDSESVNEKLATSLLFLYK